MAEAFTLAFDAPLGSLNTLRVSATASCLAIASDPDVLPAILGHERLREFPVLVLGEGSNVLFAADFHGLVLRPAWRSVRIGEDDGRTAIVRAAAGYGWDALVDWTLAQGLPGLENLALIPGLVGAAPIQNIGAYGVEASEFITAVEAWDRARYGFVRLDVADCGFGYRDSIFKREPDRWIVTNVEFRFDRQRRPALDYAGVREELAALGNIDPDPDAGRVGGATPAPPQASGPGQHRQRRQLLQESRAGERACRRIEGGQSVAARVRRWRGLEQALRGVAHRGLRLAWTARRGRRHFRAARAGAGQPRARHRRRTAHAGATRRRIRR